MGGGSLSPYGGGYSGGTPLLGQGQTPQPNYWSGGAPLQTNDPYGQVPQSQTPQPSDINDFFNRFFNFNGGGPQSLAGFGKKVQ